MKNIGTAIAVFLLSGGYLVAINKLSEFQDWVRRIPTDYVLTPFVLLLVITGALWHVNRKQQKQLSQIESQPRHDTKESRFVTHLGVWWRIYPDVEYIEDFPYCPCCEPPKKLVQTEWYPDETFKCAASGTEIKLFDQVPRKRHDVLGSLHQAYFGGGRLHEHLFREFNRLKELSPDENETSVFRRVFDIEPFNRIPRRELEQVLSRFDKPYEAISYFHRHYLAYRKYLRARPNGDGEKP